MGKGIEWAVRSGGGIMESGYEGIAESVESRWQLVGLSTKKRTTFVVTPYLACIYKVFTPYILRRNLGGEAIIIGFCTCDAGGILVGNRNWERGQGWFTFAPT
jgi:hypothetical protein